VWAFDQLAVTDADQKRSASYKQNIQRDRLEKASSSLEEFLTALQLVVDIREPGARDLPRLSQMTQRTNQFNTTTRRKSEADTAAWRKRDDHVDLIVDVRDRFGDYGTVGAILSEVRGRELYVDTLLMSCRALARGVEHRLLARLGELAVERGLDQLVVPFFPSERNEPVEIFLETVAGEYRDDAAPEQPGGRAYRIPAAVASQIRFEPERPGASDAVATSSEEGRGTEGPERALPGLFDDLHQTKLATALRDVASIQAEMTARRRPRPELSAPYAPPRPGVESRIAEAFCEVLQLQRVGVHDDFHALGGRSIHLVHLHGWLQTALRVELDITALFQISTIAELTAIVERGDESILAPAFDLVTRRARMQQQAYRRLSRRGQNRDKNHEAGVGDV
jgi:hypothetical protein